MNRRLIPSAIAVLVLIFVGLWLFRQPASSPDKMGLPQKEAPVQASKLFEAKVQTDPATTSVRESLIFGEYPPWHGGRAMSLDDPRWKVVSQREKTDKTWEWKMPIEFYGKVVDATGQPVADATVSFSWNDTSSKGSSKKETKSNVNGLFELRGVQGKILEVQVQKEGYDVIRSKNQYYFEFAGFWEKEFYEAHPENPVIFYLHKKGADEPLIYRKQEMNVTVGMPVTVEIGDQAQLQFTLVSNEWPQKGKWEAQILIINGGIIPSSEEFMMEAPMAGYQSMMTIGPQTLRPQIWVNDRGDRTQGGPFYLNMGRFYGRLDIEMTPGKDWFQVTTWLNPKAGSRNIEDDPAKHIDPDRIKSVGLEKAIEEVNGK